MLNVCSFQSINSKLLSTYIKYENIKKVLTITKISIKIILVLKMNTIQYVVIIAKRIHLFPYRTQKLSSLALMVLGG